jgi:hypothetical protein
VTTSEGGAVHVAAAAAGQAIAQAAAAGADVGMDGAFGWQSADGVVEMRQSSTDDNM